MTSFNVNVVGNVHLFNLFLPLLQKGSVKKVIAISTGVADVELIRKYEIDIGGPYSISKAALNLAVAKFSAQYQKDGILFMAISPGLVETGHHADGKVAPIISDPSGLLTDQRPSATEEQLQATAGMGVKFASYAPHFKGPITPAESVSAILGVIAGASIESGSAGSFVSHFGNKQWL
jgi:NAD(P)-dependent dehydrogenase (short-subunit alcohol dehydrogenase family)